MRKYLRKTRSKWNADAIKEVARTVKKKKLSIHWATEAFKLPFWCVKSRLRGITFSKSLVKRGGQARLDFCSHQETPLLIELWLSKCVLSFFFERRHHEVLEWMYNKINYIHQHYLFLIIHKAICFDPSVGHLQTYVADKGIGAVCTLGSQCVYINKCIYIYIYIYPNMFTLINICIY